MSNNIVESLKKRVKFAWAKYYEVNNENHEQIYDYREKLNRLSQLIQNQTGTLPTHLKEEIEEMATAMKKSYECPICMEMIEKGQLEITSCGHKYCKVCLQQLLTQPQPRCACCRRALK